MAAEQVAIGLNKQANGDQNWGDVLDAGIDEANTRLTLSGTTNPNGVVAGSWVGQKYVQLIEAGALVRAWYCTVAGAAGVAIWKPTSVFVSASNAEGPVWTDAAGQTRNIPRGVLMSSASFGPGETAGSALTNSPTATVNISSIGTHSIFVAASVQINGTNRAAGIRVSTNGGTYNSIGLPMKVPDNKTMALFATMTSMNPGSYAFRLYSDLSTNLVHATLTAIALGT